MNFLLKKKHLETILNFNKRKRCTRFLLLFTFLILSFTLPPSVCSAKNGKVKWKSRISSLQKGECFRFRICGAAKHSKTRFSSSHPKRAKINAKTGKIKARKCGIVTITAKNKKKNQKTIVLRTKLKIVPSPTKEKNSPLDNVHFNAENNINPWNHSLMLYSDRILLKEEVQNTSIQVSPPSSGKKLSYRASFLSLSENGKNVTYQLSAEDAEKMCPGNRTANGYYSITGTFFSGTLKTYYQERISTNTISGYTMTKNAEILPHVSIHLISDSTGAILSSTKSDQNGFYQFCEISDSSVILTAGSENYDEVSIGPLSPGGHALCQNIILQPADQSQLALTCQLSPPGEKQTVPKGIFLLTELESKKTIQGKIDDSARITFANSEHPLSTDYSYIHFQNQLSPPVWKKEALPLAEQLICDSDLTLERNSTYELQYIPASDSSLITDYYPVSLRFSFADMISDQVLFDITLQELPLLATKDMYINTDNLSEDPSYLDYSLYSSGGDLLFSNHLPLPDTQADIMKKLNQEFSDSALRFCDGNYYAALTALDQDQAPLSATEILPLSLTNGSLDSFSCQFSPANFIKVSLFSKTPATYWNRPVSFTLYQQFSSLWFPIGTYTIEDFSAVTEDSCKAFFSLFPLKSDTSYFILSDHPNDSLSSNLTFQDTDITSSFTKEAFRRGVYFDTTKGVIVSALSAESLEQMTPSFQLILNTSKSDITTEKDNNINPSRPLELPSEYSQPIIIDRTYFDHSDTYPNTVYTCHQKDGTLLQNFLQIPGNISADDNSYITNCFKNGTDLRTTQASYRSTPFFVT